MNFITEISNYTWDKDKFYIYYAEELKKTHQHLDDDEFLEVERISLKDINITNLSDAKTMLAVSFMSHKRR